MSQTDHAVIRTTGDAPDLVVLHDGEPCDPIDHGRDDHINDAGWAAVSIQLYTQRVRLILTYLDNALVNPPEVVGLENRPAIALVKREDYDGPGVAYGFPDRHDIDAAFVIAPAAEVAD